MTDRTAISPMIYARVAGVLYLLIAITGLFAQFVVRQTLIVPGDATATANNIMAAEPLFRLGFASDLVAFLTEVVQPVLLYMLLRPVSHTLALVMMFSRLAMAAVLGVNLLNHFAPLLLLSGAEYLSVFEPRQLHALALLFLNAHSYGYDLGLVFFSLHLFVLGYLVFQSGFYPRVLGVLLIIACVSYLINSFTRFLLPSYEAVVAQLIIAPTIIGELSFTFWLLIKGVNVERWERRARESV